MRALDLRGNLSQINEVARIHRAGDLYDEQGRRAQADDAMREALRRREQVSPAPESRHGRVDRDTRGGGGGDHQPGGQASGDQGRSDPGAPGGAGAHGPGDDGHGRGRVLDIRV